MILGNYLYHYRALKAKNAAFRIEYIVISKSIYLCKFGVDIKANMINQISSEPGKYFTIIFGPVILSLWPVEKKQRDRGDYVASQITF